MCFPVNFAKILWTPFLQNISGRLLLKAPREEFEPMRNLNEYCDPAEYVFSAVRRILSRTFDFDYSYYPTSLQNLMKYVQIDSSNQKIPISIFRLILCNDQKYESLLRWNLNTQTYIWAYHIVSISQEVVG